MIHRDVRETKATFRIENKLYRAVVDRLSWSQPSLLFRKLWLGIKEKLDSGKKKEIIEFMFGTKSITLKNIQEDKDDTD